MTIGEAIGGVQRMHLVNLATGEDFEVMFNPEQITEEVQVAYARQTIPGLSHQPLQFTNTGNHAVSMDLFATGTTERRIALVSDLRQFLLSLTVPPGNAGTIDDGAPPRVLFLWGLVWSWTAVITSVRIVSSQFTQEGEIRTLVASITLEEIRDVRMTSQDVRITGTRRSSEG